MCLSVEVIKFGRRESRAGPDAPGAQIFHFCITIRGINRKQSEKRHSFYRKLATAPAHAQVELFEAATHKKQSAR